MLKNYEYMQAILSQNLRWIIGHMTEHFIPKDMHEELILKCFEDQSEEYKDTLRKMNLFTQSVLEESHIKVLIYEEALNDFAVSGKLDFYNHKIYLNEIQRLRYMRYLETLIEKNQNFEIKLIRGHLITDFQHIPNPTLFISDNISYLRLQRSRGRNNISILNRYSIKEMFSCFYDEIWREEKYNVIEGRDTVLKLTQHIIHYIEILSRMN